MSALDGEVIWSPGADDLEGSRLSAFLRWLRDERGLTFDGYRDLHAWSVRELEAFWQAAWDYFGVRSSTPPRSVLSGPGMPDVRWFEGAEAEPRRGLPRRRRTRRPGTRLG